jgi:hypothetical protein
MVRELVRASSCLGNNALETGHRRVPEPPERITGWIIAMGPSHTSGWPEETSTPGSISYCGETEGVVIIVVVGVGNADLFLNVARLPACGKTVLCLTYILRPGSKSVNQAVAAAYRCWVVKMTDLRVRAQPVRRTRDWGDASLVPRRTMA